MANLRLRPAFIADVRGRIEWLAEHREEEQLESFLTGLASVRAAITRDPRAGAVVREDERYVVGLRLFPRPLPYVVYYAHEKTQRVAEIYLVRLFGAGQDRSGFDLSDWPW